MKKPLIVLKLLLILVSINSYSQENKNPINAKFLIEGGIEYGGDEFLTVLFTDGSDQTMRAGQGGYIAFGGQFEFQNLKHFMLRSSIGYKFNTTAADNANIRLTRLPLTLIPFFKINEDFRLGLGITSHQSVKFNGDGFVENVNFKSSLGARFEFGYKWVALTYSAIKYKPESSEDLSASSIGISISYTFPNN